MGSKGSYPLLADAILGRGIRPYAAFHAPSDLHASAWYQGSFMRHRDLATELVRHAGTGGYVVEVGSYMGNSATAWARAAKRLGFNTTIVCVDTWLGEANFWRAKGMMLGPQARDGTPRIYEMFMLNTVNLSHWLLPVRMAADTGLRVLAELIQKGRISRPSVVYVDTAHTYPESVLEMRLAWALLPPGSELRQSPGPSWWRNNQWHLQLSRPF